MRTIAVFNRKGGSGKTTTAVNLAAALGDLGARVLIVDLDVQASASHWLGREAPARFRLFPSTGAHDLGRLAEPTGVFGVDLVPPPDGLEDAEAALRAELSLSIARGLQGLQRRWSYVIVDCPPTMSYLTVGILAGVREVIIPVEAHAIAVPGVESVLAEIGRLRSSLRTNLAWATIVPCRVSRTRHAWAVVEELGEEFGPLVSGVQIRESVRVAEAWGARQPVTRYAPDSGASHDFRRLAVEVAEGPSAGHEIRVLGWPRREARRRPEPEWAATGV
jgi:chromosome partitioning protein